MWAEIRLERSEASKNKYNSQKGQSMNTSKGTEGINEEGATEVKVDTVNYISPPGQDQESKKEDIEVTHLKRTDGKPGIGGAMTEAAGKVAEKIQSAKKAIFGTDNEKSK